MKAILSSFLLLLLCTLVHATDFTVTNANDAGAGSLRQAITDANGDATATALAPHTITFNGAYTITLSSALPSLNNHVVVNATGNNVITINAFSGSSVLVVSSGRTVVLNYLTLQGATGVTNGGGITNNGTTTLNNCIIQNNAATNGGGIRTFGNLTCNNCSFSNNTGFGSAIYSASLGTITLEKCILQNNSGTGAALHVVLSGTATTIAGMATLNINNSIIKNNTNSSSSNTGGGVFAAATTSISNSEISGNSACRGGGITLGLGLTNTSTSTTYKTQLTIDKSTISGNSTNGLNLSALGGGIYIQGGSADLTANSSITNSTISGNSTSAIGGVVTTTAGGGINIGGGGTSAWVTTVTISNCTLTGNTVDGNSSASRGGALERVQGSVILNYSIAAGNNSNSSANNKDIHTNTTTIFGSTTGRNLLGAVGNGTTATGNSLFALSGSTVTTGNVLLTNAISTVLNTSLADNGGTTALPDGSYIKTHALVSGGSQTAINPTAAASGLQTVDQRGATRDATPDIGAFEFAGVGLPVVLTDFSVTLDANQKGALLKWITASEINNSHFEVLRSNNGVDFVSVQTILGKGNTASSTAYSFLDNSVSAGRYYYKLKQLDKDGKYSYSEIKWIDITSILNNTIRIYPNPLVNGSALFVEYKANMNQVSILHIVNSFGVLVYQTTVKPGLNTLTIPSLSIGVYFIKIADKTQQLIISSN